MTESESDRVPHRDSGSMSGAVENALEWLSRRGDDGAVERETPRSSAMSADSGMLVGETCQDPIGVSGGTGVVTGSHPVG